jgi:hypothetical protein
MRRETKKNQNYLLAVAQATRCYFHASWCHAPKSGAWRISSKIAPEPTEAFS